MNILFLFNIIDNGRLLLKVWLQLCSCCPLRNSYEIISVIEHSMGLLVRDVSLFSVVTSICEHNIAF